MKAQPVKTCYGCIFSAVLKFNFYDHSTRKEGRYIRVCTNKKIFEYHNGAYPPVADDDGHEKPPPDWCPLPDYPEDE